MSKVQGSIRAEAAARGVPYSTVQRERRQSESPHESPTEPQVANQVRYYHRVLRLVPEAIAAQLGITEATVAEVLAAEPPVPDPISGPWGSGSTTQPSVVGAMESVSLSAPDPDRSPPSSIYTGPTETIRLSY